MVVKPDPTYDPSETQWPLTPTSPKTTDAFGPTPGYLGEPNPGPCLLPTLVDALAVPLQPALAKSPCPLPHHHVNPHLPFGEAACVEGSPPKI